MKMLRNLWSDENGFIVSSELILIATILVIAMVVGFQTVRDAVLQELGDVAEAIGNISQDYSYGGASGHCSAVSGSLLIDQADNCENPGGPDNDKNCVIVCLSPTSQPE